MTTWNSGPGFFPPPDPNQGFYGGQPGYPPQQPYPGAVPQPGVYPGAPPAQGGYPGGMPSGYPGGPQGYPGGGGGYPPGAPAPGFAPPPPYVHNPTGGDPPFNQPPQQPGIYSGVYGDLEADVKGFDFNDKLIRHGFIRKVYAILMVQLAITMAFIATFLYHEPTKKFMRTHFYIPIIALVFTIILMLIMACFETARRKSPLNLIFLGLFTIAEGVVVASIASSYDTEAVLMAVGLTTAVCLGLTIFAFQTRWDFTVMGGILFVALIILFIFSIVAALVKVKIVTLIYSCLGALLFSIYLVYDTQLMMGGKHKYSISPEEYIFAALNLYLDIINIFIYILSIIGASRD